MCSPPAGPYQPTDVQWRKRLSSQVYAVLRQGGTARAYSSPLLKKQGKARFLYAGCALPVFPPKTKFENGTGKLRFRSHFPGAVRIAADRSMGMVREIVCCTRCDGHLGHVFDDGMPPIHLRYCVNGAALTFRSG